MVSGCPPWFLHARGVVRSSDSSGGHLVRAGHYVKTPSSGCRCNTSPMWGKFSNLQNFSTESCRGSTNAGKTSTNDNPGVFAYVGKISYRVRAYERGFPYSRGRGCGPGRGWLWCWSWDGGRLSRWCVGASRDCVDIYAVTISEKRRKFWQYKVAKGPPWVMSIDFRMCARVCIHRYYPHPKYISGLFQGEGQDKA